MLDILRSIEINLQFTMICMKKRKRTKVKIKKSEFHWISMMPNIVLLIIRFKY